MPQAGWYADPYGSGGHRWWDGTRWTEHLTAPPPQQVPAPQYAPAQPPQYAPVAPVPQYAPVPPAPQYAPGQPAAPYAAPAGQPAPAAWPVLQTRRLGTELRADPHSVTWEKKTIELATAEFVGYTVKQNRMRGAFGIGSVHTSTEYHFEIGRFPISLDTAIAYNQDSMRANTPPPNWQFLVDLARTYVEPRLLRQFLAAIEAGQTVDVAKMTINRDGFAAAGVSRRWEGIAGVALDKGHYFVYELGASRPIVGIPQQNQNVMLLPQIFAALKR